LKNEANAVTGRRGSAQKHRRRAASSNFWDAVHLAHRDSNQIREIHVIHPIDGSEVPAASFRRSRF
jgi:hypothetical protein